VTAEAALRAVFETAVGLSLLPNVVAAGPHFLAAATFGTAAAMSFAGGGGQSVPSGGGGAGPTGGAGPAFGTAFDQAPAAAEQEGPGTTVIVQYMSPNSREGFEFLTDQLNEGARNGTGARLDASLIEGLG
jgi:hypothetical protein